VFKYTSRGPSEGEDLGIFDVALQLVELLSNCRHVHNSGTRCMETKQLGVWELRTLFV